MSRSDLSRRRFLQAAGAVLSAAPVLLSDAAVASAARFFAPAPPALHSGACGSFVSTAPRGGRSIHIAMSALTVDALANSGFSLYSFKAVQCADRAGMPVIWLQSQDFGMHTTFAWTDQYQAYTSPDRVHSGTGVAATNQYPITVGQVLTVDNRSGTGIVTTDGVPDAMAFRNTTNVQLACGLMQQHGDVAAPLCRLPLYGGEMQIITPLSSVLLLFSTQPGNVGDVIARSYGPGILIDLTGVALRNVSFDVNDGWSWGSFTWAQSVPAGTYLAPLLILPDATCGG